MSGLPLALPVPNPTPNVTKIRTFKASIVLFYGYKQADRDFKAILRDANYLKTHLLILFFFLSS
jgi:hypothetical protein